MKYFIPLDLGFGVGERIVYGPYEDNGAVANALTQLWPDEKDKRVVIFDGTVASVKILQEQSGDQRMVDGGNRCYKCGRERLFATVSHRVLTVQSYTFVKFKNVKMPYCPECESRPNRDGAPIYVDNDVIPV